MSGHTPGPWRVEDPLGPGILSIVAGSEQPAEWIDIAQVGVEEADVSPQESAANAALLAAAPGLADALEALLARRAEYMEECPLETTIAEECWPTADVEAAHAALAKAGRLP